VPFGFVPGSFRVRLSGAFSMGWRIFSPFFGFVFGLVPKLSLCFQQFEGFFPQKSIVA
jgi:hypothetical protein